MAYCIVEDIRAVMDEQELIQLTDDADTGAVDEAVIAQAIADAETEIDGYLAARYPLPLPDGTGLGLLKTLAKDIAIYRLYLRRMGPPEYRADQYKAAIKTLGKIAEKKMGLGPDDPEPPSEADIPEFESSPAVFGRENMTGW